MKQLNVAQKIWKEYVLLKIDNYLFHIIGPVFREPTPKWNWTSIFRTVVWTKVFYCNLVSKAVIQPAPKRKSDNFALIIHSIMGLSQWLFCVFNRLNKYKDFVCAKSFRLNKYKKCYMPKSRNMSSNAKISDDLI